MHIQILGKMGELVSTFFGIGEGISVVLRASNHGGRKVVP